MKRRFALLLLTAFAFGPVSGGVNQTVAQYPVDTEAPFSAYSEAGGYSGSGAFGQKKFYLSNGTYTGQFRLGEYQNVGGAALYQTGGLLNGNTNWMICGQNSGGTAASPAYSKFQLSGNGKAYLSSSTGDGTVYCCTTDSDANVAIFDIQPDSNAAFYTKGLNFGNSTTTGYSKGYFRQHSGTAYIGAVTIKSDPTVTTDNFFTSFALDSGRLAVGSFTKAPEEMSFTGGTLAVGSIASGNLNVNGSTFEIYGNLSAGITGYSLDNIKASADLGVSRYGTTTVAGNYNQTAGNLILSFKDFGTHDTLSAANITLSNTNIGLDTFSTACNNGDVPLSTFFQTTGSLTIGENVTFTSAPGWNWTYDAANKKLTNSVTRISQPQNISSGNYAYDNGALVNGTFSMTGGELIVEKGYFQNFTMNQSGGTTVFNEVTWWPVLGEARISGGSKVTSTWNLSGDAKLYAPSDSRYTEVTCRDINLGKAYEGKLTIADNALVHLDIISVGVDYDYFNGCGTIVQTGGEAYYNTLQFDVRYAAGVQFGNNKEYTGLAGDNRSSSYTLTDGKLAANTIQSYQNYSAGATLKPQVNLNGGTAMFANVKALDLVNNGSTIEIEGGLNALNDFNYLLTGQDRPTGFNKIGTMTLTGSTFTMNAGQLVFDVDSSLFYDQIVSNSSVTLSGGELHVNGNLTAAAGASYKLISAASVISGPAATYFRSDNASMDFMEWKFDGGALSYRGAAQDAVYTGSWSPAGFDLGSSTLYNVDVQSGTLTLGTVNTSGNNVKFSGGTVNINNGNVSILNGDAAQIAVDLAGSNISVTANNWLMLGKNNSTSRIIATMTAGSIKGANGNSGLCVYPGVDFTMSGGTIGADNTKATRIHMVAGSKMTIQDGAKVGVASIEQDYNGGITTDSIINVEGGTVNAASWNAGLFSAGSTAGTGVCQVNISGGAVDIGTFNVGINEGGAVAVSGGELTVDTFNVGALGSFTQTAGKTSFKWNGTSTITGAASVTGGELNIVHTSPYLSATDYATAQATGPLGANGTATSAVTLTSSMTGWKWGVDGNGKLVNANTPLNKAAWEALPNKTIADGYYRLVEPTSNNCIGGNYTMTGGNLIIEKAYLGGAGTAGFTMNQSAGTTLFNGKQFYLVFNEGSDANNTEWTLSGTARFYAFDEGADMYTILGKNKNAQAIFNVGSPTETASSVIFHADKLVLGDNYANANGCGVVNVNSGEAFINSLQMMNRYDSGTEKTPATLNVKGGTAIINKITTTQTGPITPQVNLTGGIVVIGESAISITNNGSEIKVMGALDSLNDFIYLCNGDENTAKPTGMTDVGVMKIAGDYIQNSGSLVFDVLSETEFDKLEVSGAVNMTGGSLVVNYTGEADPATLGALNLIDAGSIDLSSVALDVFMGKYVLSNADQTGFWLASADGSFTYAGASQPIPEPGTCVLLILGAVGLAFWRKRR